MQLFVITSAKKSYCNSVQFTYRIAAFDWMINNWVYLEPIKSFVMVSGAQSSKSKVFFLFCRQSFANVKNRTLLFCKFVVYVLTKNLNHVEFVLESFSKSSNCIRPTG